jgi:hypothetical protein
MDADTSDSKVLESITRCRPSRNVNVEKRRADKPNSIASSIHIHGEPHSRVNVVNADHLCVASMPALTNVGPQCWAIRWSSPVLRAEDISAVKPWGGAHPTITTDFTQHKSTHLRDQKKMTLDIGASIEDALAPVRQLVIGD